MVVVPENTHRGWTTSLLAFSLEPTMRLSYHYHTGYSIIRLIICADNVVVFCMIRPDYIIILQRFLGVPGRSLLDGAISFGETQSIRSIKACLFSFAIPTFNLDQLHSLQHPDDCLFVTVEETTTLSACIVGISSCRRPLPTLPARRFFRRPMFRSACRLVAF